MAEVVAVRMVATARLERQPFALWTLDLSANRGLDLSTVQSIELEFSASFLPFN